MTNEEKQASFEAYLNETLPPEQQRAFEALLASDRALREEFALYRALPAALGDPAFRRYRDNLRHVLDDNRPPAPRAARKLYWSLAALLLLAGLIAGLCLYRNRSTSGGQLLAAYFTPPPTLYESGTPRNNGADTDLPRVEQLYQRKEYASALAELERMAGQPGFAESSAFHYQMAVLALATRDGRLALRHLDRIEVGYHYEKQWYRALALLLTDGNAPATRAVLQEIAGSDSPFRADAARLLQE